ncbi:MAG: phage tail protein [Anaerolineales bacterium]|nr:phage tail protein [Anaerolineales bacterium]MCA9977301.1 phage tail protein [Anaerolineales bacterium]MCB8988998.1 phage tail protein [Ardenticatenaceae bacterium]
MFSAFATAATINLNPFLAYNYWVEIDGLFLFGFSKVDGLESSLHVTDQQEGGVNHFVHKLPGHVTQSNLTFTKGLTIFDMMWDWYDKTTQGIIERKNGTIILLNEVHFPIMGWNFHNAFPVKWTGPSFDASSNAIAFESLELVHEGISKANLLF